MRRWAGAAGLAFVLSVYPLISQLRGTGLQLADSGALEPQGAMKLVRQSGRAELAATTRYLTEDHEHLRRFPVLYYFESGNPEESLSAVLRGSALLLVALHCVPDDEVEFAAVYGETLEHIVARLLDDLERDFVGGRRPKGRRAEPSEEEASAHLEELCSSLRAGDGNDRCRPAHRRLGPLLARVDMVLDALAREHGHGVQGVLPS